LVRFLEIRHRPMMRALNGATTYSWIGGDEQDIDHRRAPIDNQR
jgi:hypothetical protein